MVCMQRSQLVDPIIRQEKGFVKRNAHQRRSNQQNQRGEGDCDGEDADQGCKELGLAMSSLKLMESLGLLDARKKKKKKRKRRKRVSLQERKEKRWIERNEVGPEFIQFKSVFSTYKKLIGSSSSSKMGFTRISSPSKGCFLRNESSPRQLVVSIQKGVF